MGLALCLLDWEERELVVVVVLVEARVGFLVGSALALGFDNTKEEPGACVGAVSADLEALHVSDRPLPSEPRSWRVLSREGRPR